MPDRPTAPLECLTAAEADVLAAVLDRLIPADEHGPGATESGVLVYVDRALAGPLALHRATYAETLVALDDLARSAHGVPFAGLAPEAQDVLLRSLEDGSAPGLERSGPDAFALVRQHAVEGMFADPAHGGNVGFAGWRLVGFPGPKRTFEERDQLLDVPVEPAWTAPTETHGYPCAGPHGAEEAQG